MKMNWRIVYALLWFLTLVTYSLPWASTSDGEVFYGWNFTMPFSITYLIGMLLGLIVLATKWKPIPMTVVAGVLMILGFFGASIGMGMMTGVGWLVGKTVKAEGGIGLSFLTSIIYMVGGAVTGKKMTSS
jgi:hypothetical protein